MSSQARNSWLYRFKERNNSRSPLQSRRPIETTSRAFMESIRTFISILRVRPELLLNMDHTTVALDVSEKLGCIHRVTVALCCAADGTKLKPFIVFKTQPNGYIDRSFRESNQCHFVAQAKGWMDASVVNAWIEKVNKLYID